MRRTGVVLAAVLVLATPIVALAGPADVANDVANSIMSPFCPGLTLHDCPSTAATELRERIEAWARSGMSRADITDRLQGEYGTAIASTPPRSGAGWIAWALPGAVLLAGAALGSVLLRRWSGRAAEPDQRMGTTATSAERARLEAELATLRDPT